MITPLRGDLSLLTLRNIYCAKFQSLIRCGIILWGGEIESVRVLNIQKRVLLAIKGLNKRKSCRLIFKELNVLTVTALYIFEVLCYIKKKNYLQRHLDMYKHNTRRKCDFHVSSCNTSLLKTTKEFFPNVRDRMKMNISINPNFIAMVTWHGRARAYLHRFRLIDNATCPCNKEDQTIDNLIHQCTLIHTNRELLKKNVQQSGNWPASKQELITQHLRSFLIFTKSINFDEL